MSAYEQARAYAERQPAAVSGSNGHGQTYAVACGLINGYGLSGHDARSILGEYNQRCAPPWSDSELDHKIKQAENAQHPKPRGHLLRSAEHSSRPERPPYRPPMPAKSAAPAVKVPRYAISDSTELPAALPDGARALLRSAFLIGEGIRIAPAALNDEKREVPEDGGLVLSREEWLRKLDKHDGRPNGPGGIYCSSRDQTGVFISVNPMKAGGSRDADVTAYRHVLLEFDNISKEEQWGIIIASRVPCSAIISSGGKSVHAWVRVDAKDRREYDERVATLYAHFGGYNPDNKNKNPSRFSRLPNCIRLNSRQELLRLQAGCESFSEWMAEIQADGIGETVSVNSLLDFVPEEDTNTVLGARWLCRGGSCLVIGPSGVGKSSLTAQLAGKWAIGLPEFGVKPVKPLKSLVVQAENDMGDLAEMIQGVYGGLPLLSDKDDALFRANLVFVRDTTHTGFAFTEALRRLIDRHKPDLVWLDPLLSFIGADISKQEVCSQFLRNWLNPISEATGVVWMAVHHTGKPPSDKSARKDWTSSDQAYSGIGSSELVNWARAVVVLRAINDHHFELKLAKRGKRAQATHLNGEPTVAVYLRHAQNAIRWEQTEPPAEPEPTERKGGKWNGKEAKGEQPSRSQKLAASNLHEVLSRIPAEGESANSLGDRLSAFSRKKGETVSAQTCRKTVVDLLVQNGKILFDEKAELYRKGPNV